MTAVTYGSGANGPGHCFHQHLTFYLRTAGAPVPPAAAYAGYVLRWEDLWSAVTGRKQMFDAAADHFAGYTESSQCFEKYGLSIERIPFQPETVDADIRAAKEQNALLLAAVDTYYLPSFVEYQQVHGLTMCALLDAPDGTGNIDLWHWENSSMVPSELVAQSITQQGSKVWKLEINQATRLPAQELLDQALEAYEVLGEPSSQAVTAYTDKIEVMVNEDPPLPDDESQRNILFHVPYRLLQNGSFRTIWLVRSAANRLMHARGTFEELLQWGAASSDHPAIEAILPLAKDAYTKWKTVNVVCARYDIYPNARTLPIIYKQLQEALDADARLGQACRQSKERGVRS
ncbi:hypothetical protein [Brevibacillus dissolubilis]|uniref:hypothetical protein n=1 Tax=Brevibacillus dissolubilis TaxID=1844116 RepID=UPI00111640CB|nr:hypothetical protein [Brevibacillus dissolubilis]